MPVPGRKTGSRQRPYRRPARGGISANTSERGSGWGGTGMMWHPIIGPVNRRADQPVMPKWKGPPRDNRMKGHRSKMRAAVKRNAIANRVARGQSPRSKYRKTVPLKRFPFVQPSRSRSRA